MQYWYSAQLRQYRLQFIRAFSNFSVKTGRGGPNGVDELIRVPCRYGDPTRIAASIVRGNSENKVLAVPFISCIIQGLNMSPSRRQDPQLVVPVVVNERKYNDELGHYTNEVGNRYTVERYMPVPYDLTMQVDIWTDNTDIKEQLLEQILVLYNPAVDIQTSVNPIDWTVLSYIEMQDSITWSSRSIPVGTDNPIDVSTMQFKIPIWINPPAKVKKQSIINTIITNIVEGTKAPEDMEWTEYEFYSRNITTPGDATIKLTPRPDGSSNIFLCDDALSQTDKDFNPTVTFATAAPNLFVGMQFRWNNNLISINHTEIKLAIDDVRKSLVGTNLNCVIYNDTTMQFVNTSGGDNTFEDVVPGSLAALGIAETTYPGGQYAWWRLLTLYGSLKPYSTYGANASQIRLKTQNDLDQTTSDLIGWIDIDPVNQNQIIWTPDFESFPSATLPAIDLIVDPLTSGPGGLLPPPAIGQRYLLTESPAEQSVRWGTMTAQANDIVEFNGSQWVVSWSAALNTNGVQYVMNNRSGLMYKWDGTWSAMLQKQYLQGLWRLSL
jgi:hypothetical protein